MTAPRGRRWALAGWLAAPLLAVPLLAFGLMEYGPERSFVFAVYLLAWAVAFIVAGIWVARRRPFAPVREVLLRAGGWALLFVVVTVAALIALQPLVAPRGR